MDARETALLTLYDVFYRDSYSNLALRHRLSYADLGREDTALATSLVYGTVSRHFTLEYVIRQYSKVKLKKIDKYVKLILEIGIYQLVFMDKIPQSAAVNESVKLAKKYGRRGTDGFVNAVLRSFCRDGCVIKYPDDGTDRDLSVKYSYSEEMTSFFVKIFGVDRAKSIMDALNGVPPLMLRANALKTDAGELVSLLSERGIAAEIFKGHLVKADGFDIRASDLYRNGYFTVQDQGAYCASAVLCPKEGESVLDMCAAPGGKSTHMAELMRGTGTVIACDIHEHKIKLIDDAAARLGLSNIHTRLLDATEKRDRFLLQFDKVLCDVPCSGLGIIRRKPDIKLKKVDPDSLINIQSAILRNGADYLRPGGELVYSTCTIDPSENEGVTGSFLKEHRGYERVFEQTLYPDTDMSDGFYICKMIKKV